MPHIFIEVEYTPEAQVMVQWRDADDKVRGWACGPAGQFEDVRKVASSELDRYIENKKKEEGAHDEYSEHIIVQRKSIDG